MLDIKFIRENKEIVERAAKLKKVDVDINKLLEVDDRRKVLQQLIDEKRAQQNAESSRMRSATEEERRQIIEKMSAVKEEAKQLEEQAKAVTKDWFGLMIKIPNIPSPDTPVGEDESGNKVLRECGEKTKFDFAPKAHWDLGKDLGIIDTEKAAEISGSRFSYLLGDLVRVQYALLGFLFDTLTNQSVLETIIQESGLSVSPKPFVPVLPPIMMKSGVMNKMGRLQPIDERYYFEKDDLVFIGSAEHTLGPLHMDEILSEDDLPIRYIGYSVAMRREAGTYGKDTKGILRQHQFDKAEMESFCLPENSYAEQDFFVAIQEYILKKLGIPYRVMIICTGDMGGPDHRQIDVECWMPGQDTYRETHTSDLMQGFQARRLNTKVRRKTGDLEFVHMNDATAIAMGRTLIAIMENFQQADGSIKIPEILRSYMGGSEFISKK